MNALLIELRGQRGQRGQIAGSPVSTGLERPRILPPHLSQSPRCGGNPAWSDLPPLPPQAAFRSPTMRGQIEPAYSVTCGYAPACPRCPRWFRDSARVLPAMCSGATKRRGKAVDSDCSRALSQGLTQ